MGGYGTWQMAMSMPSYYAAIVPVCGGGMYWNAGRIKNLPVWAFHGAKDQTVAVEESVKMVDKINAWGGNAKLTIYPENTHDAWTDTYSNDEVYKWFLEHKNKNEQEQTTKLEGSKLFG
jgi:predicted peptidase